MSEPVDTTKAVGFIASLQVAEQPHQFYVAAFFVLFVDCVLVFIGQPGLAEMATTGMMIDSSFVLKIALIFVIYLLFVSTVLGPLSSLFHDLTWGLQNKLFFC